MLKDGTINLLDKIMTFGDTIKHTTGARVAWLVMLVIGLCAVAGAQSVRRFQAQVDRQQVTAGDQLTYTLVIEHDGTKNFQRPTPPDWGGLQPLGAPQSIEKTMIVNRRTQHYLVYQWTLSAPRVGRFTIGPASIQHGGRASQTQPIPIEVLSDAAIEQLPDELKNEGILFAQTKDAQLNNKLKGRLFLRAEISDAKPYVGQPAIVSYWLYHDGVQLRGPISCAPPAVPNGLTSEVLFDAAQLQFQKVQAGPREYQRALIHRMALTPSPGTHELPGYRMSINVRDGNQRTRRNPRDRFGDPYFDSMFDSFMSDSLFNSNAAQAILASPPIRIEAQPLPDPPATGVFSGTVGDFKLTGAVDRIQASEDEFITLSLTLEGRGAIEMAGAPSFPDNGDFRLDDQSHKVEKDIRKESLGGRKLFEYVLSAKHSGRLQIPTLEYMLFDPYAEAYRIERTGPLSVDVAPGQILPAGTATLGMQTPRERTVHDLNPLKTVIQLYSHRPELLCYRAVFWVPQLSALFFLGFAWRHERRRQKLDPAQARRQNAWRSFERRLGPIRHQAAHKDKQADAVGALEQSVRMFIADRFNLSADGLTRPEIERLLEGGVTTSEWVPRFCDLIDRCQARRYSPIGDNGDIVQWIDDISGLIKEHLRS